mgnify:CR=1 FL=1
MVLVFAVSCLSSASAVENSDPNENIQELFLNSIPIESDVPGQYQFIAYHEPVQTRSASQQKAVTTFTIVPGNEEEAQLLDAITRTGGGSNYKYQWDNSGGVKNFILLYIIPTTAIPFPLTVLPVAMTRLTEASRLYLKLLLWERQTPRTPRTKPNILPVPLGVIMHPPVGSLSIIFKALSNIWGPIIALISNGAVVHGEWS